MYSAALVFLVIFGAGEAEYRSVIFRERQEALWRDELERRLAAVPTQEPPILNN